MRARLAPATYSFPSEGGRARLLLTGFVLLLFWRLPLAGFAADRPIRYTAWQMRLAVLPFSLLLAGCVVRAPSSVEEGVSLLEDLVPLGTDLILAAETLQEREFFVWRLSPSDCGEFFIRPDYECRGGPALHVTLNENARPWNPFYSPSLDAFLAFDAQKNLADVQVSLEGGD